MWGEKGGERIRDSREVVSVNMSYLHKFSRGHLTPFIEYVMPSEDSDIYLYFGGLCQIPSHNHNLNSIS